MSDSVQQGLTVQGHTMRVQRFDTVRVKNPEGEGTMLINKSDYDLKKHGRVVLEDSETEKS